MVLPAATWGESDGTTTNMERRVSRVRPAMDLPPGVRTDLDVVTTIGNRVAPGLFDRTDPEPVFEELAALTAGTPADLSGISYGRLDAQGAVRWPAPDAVSEGGYRYLDDGEWAFETPSGRARFSTARHAGVPEPVDDDYPLTLTTGREADGYNTGVRSRDEGTPDAPLARVHPTTLDGTDLGFESAPAKLGTDEDGSAADATIESRRGAVPVRVEAAPAVPEGLVWLPIHHPRTNELTLPETDPRSAEPNFKQCAVRLRPADANRADLVADAEVIRGD